MLVCRFAPATFEHGDSLPDERSPGMPDILRHASGTWSGKLQSGTGTASTESGALRDAKVSFTTRFEEPLTGSNPEELIAAAHSSCFSMALSSTLGRQGHTPTEIRTKATLSLNRG